MSPWEKIQALENKVDSSIRKMWIAVAVGLGIVLAIVLITLGLVISIGASNHETNVRILDCTTPHHSCYEQGQQSTGKAVSQIVTQINNHTDKVVTGSTTTTIQP